MTNFEKLIKNMTPDMLTALVMNHEYFTQIMGKEECYKATRRNGLCPTLDDGYPMNCEDHFLQWLEKEFQDE